MPSNESTTPSPQDKPRRSYDEVEEAIRHLDYEENAMLEGVLEGSKLLQARRDREREAMAHLTKNYLSPWGWKLHDHLREFKPRLYAALQKEGTLYDHCQKVADQTKLEMSDLLDTGLPYNQAFELIKDQLYPPPEA